VRLLRRFAGKGLLITRSGDGFSLITARKYARHPAQAREVYDETGCGDTFHGAFALGLARGMPEIEAALLALSVQGNANSAIPRERVIRSYRMFMQEHKEIAGFVAQDLATWQYWDAVPEYVALMKSSTPQQYPSRIAIVAYLRQAPNASAIDLPLLGVADPPADAARAASAIGSLPK
jgi:hypothetical protein